MISTEKKSDPSSTVFFMNVQHLALELVAPLQGSLVRLSPPISARPDLPFAVS